MARAGTFSGKGCCSAPWRLWVCSRMLGCTGAGGCAQRGGAGRGRGAALGAQRTRWCGPRTGSPGESAIQEAPGDPQGGPALSQPHAGAHPVLAPRDAEGHATAPGLGPSDPGPQALLSPLASALCEGETGFGGPACEEGASTWGHLPARPPNSRLPTGQGEKPVTRGGFRHPVPPSVRPSVRPSVPLSVPPLRRPECLLQGWLGWQCLPASGSGRCALAAGCGCSRQEAPWGPGRLGSAESVSRGLEARARPGLAGRAGGTRSLFPSHRCFSLCLSPSLPLSKPNGSFSRDEE